MKTIEVISDCPLPEEKPRRKAKYPFYNMSNIGDGFRLDEFDNKLSNNIRAYANQFSKRFPEGSRPLFRVRKHIDENGKVGTMVVRIK